MPSKPSDHTKVPSTFWSQGEPFVWATGAALAACLLMIIALLIVVLWNGGGVFWPHPVVQVKLDDGRTLLGEFKQRSVNPDDDVVELQYKTGNRDLAGGNDFQWVREQAITERTFPEDVYVLERLEGGNFYGFFKGLETPSFPSIQGNTPAERLSDALARDHALYEETIAPILAQTAELAYRLQDIEEQILSVQYRKQRLVYEHGGGTVAQQEALKNEMNELRQEAERIKRESDSLVNEQAAAEATMRRNIARFETVDGKTLTLPLHELVRFTRPNAMGTGAKLSFYGAKVVELLTDEPRESNTEGGLFPAIFGTVMLIFLMAFTSFPLGVLAGIYLREYAKEGILVRLVRIAVNNLAGIPSIVYGIFGLGFFIYQAGGYVDATFFPHLEAANQTVYNTGGILWASMTLGILTVPVVIVSVEEALGAIPAGVREGSLALGATKFQTLHRVLLPMASPGILTGFILAMARAAGEVAPLMITGVVKMAPTLPVDGTWPFFHLDRKFMHLGFHIYDIGFQSPNVEAAKPMVYVTTFLLLMIVLAMTSLAIVMRNRMRKRYEIRSI